MVKTERVCHRSRGTFRRTPDLAVTPPLCEGHSTGTGLPVKLADASRIDKIQGNSGTYFGQSHFTPSPLLPHPVAFCASHAGRPVNDTVACSSLHMVVDVAKQRRKVLFTRPHTHRFQDKVSKTQTPVQCSGCDDGCKALTFAAIRDWAFVPPLPLQVVHCGFTSFHGEGGKSTRSANAYRAGFLPKEDRHGSDALQRNVFALSPHVAMGGCRQTRGINMNSCIAAATSGHLSAGETLASACCS